MPAPHWHLVEDTGIVETQVGHNQPSRLARICAFLLRSSEARGGERTIRVDGRNTITISCTNQGSHEKDIHYQILHRVNENPTRAWIYHWELAGPNGEQAMFKLRASKSHRIDLQSDGEQLTPFSRLDGDKRRNTRIVADQTGKEITIFPRILSRILEREAADATQQIHGLRQQLADIFAPIREKPKPEEIITIVDENDSVIGAMPRTEADEKKDAIRRVTKGWLMRIVRDRDGRPNFEILLAQRSLTKEHGRAKWGPAFAGTVVSGENNDRTAFREMHEEIGIEGTEVVMMRLAKHPHLTNPRGEAVSNPNFSQHYLAILLHDKRISDFKLDPDEVAQVRWISREDLENELSRKGGKGIPQYGRSVTEFLAEIRELEGRMEQVNRLVEQMAEAETVEKKRAVAGASTFEKIVLPRAWPN